jgi:ATP-dependent DNA helicase RecQ
VLTGKTTPQIERFQHNKVSTYGIGRELNQAQWSSIYRQLTAAGFLETDIEAYGGLRLTETARPILKGEQAIWLRRDATPENRASKAERSARLKEAFEDANDDPLWLALKARRMAFAKEQSVPPYIIFHDATLIEILNQKPHTLGDMGKISGIGQAKLERYGEAFLEVIATDENT